MHPKIINIVLLCFLLTIFIGCGTVATVRPITKGKSAFAVSMGGPVAQVSGMNIPLPYAVARYRYGINDNLTLNAGCHLLLFAFGVIGLDGGVTYNFLKQLQWKPSLCLGANIYSYVGNGGTRIFPELELIGSYLWKNRFLTYFGIQSMYQFTQKPIVVFAPFIGEEIRLSRKFAFSFETKWYAPNETTKPRLVDYKISVNNKGALGFVLGLNYHLGGWYE